MNYGIEPKSACDCASANMPNESMTDILREANAITGDLLGLVRRINSHLFGSQNHCCEKKEANPACFREELQATRTELHEIARELSEMCCLLGL